MWYPPRPPRGDGRGSAEFSLTAHGTAARLTLAVAHLETYAHDQARPVIAARADPAR